MRRSVRQVDRGDVFSVRSKMREAASKCQHTTGKFAVRSCEAKARLRGRADAVSMRAVAEGNRNLRPPVVSPWRGGGVQSSVWFDFYGGTLYSPILVETAVIICYAEVFGLPFIADSLSAWTDEGYSDSNFILCRTLP